MRIFALAALIIISATGCGLFPTSSGPILSTIVIPDSSDDNAVVVFFRKLSPPFGLTPSIMIDGVKQHKLPNKSYFYVEVPAGEHEFHISWGAMAIGWKGNFTIEKNKTYYYQIEDDPYTVSELSVITHINDSWVKGSIEFCCRLIDSMAASAKLKTAEQIQSAFIKPKLTEHQLKNFFSEIAIGMLIDEVAVILGEPNKVLFENTNKSLIPFYMGSDHIRYIFSYTGIGYVVFLTNRKHQKVLSFNYDETAI